MPAYLEETTVRLAVGMASLPEATRGRHAGYVRRAQQADGGFGGREGGSDLYYTGFALRGLAVLGELQGEVAQRAAAFLRSQGGTSESIVDLVSLVYSVVLLDAAAGIDVFGDESRDWRETMRRIFENLRRDDGGYAKGPQGTASSTYHTFLVVLCLQLLGLSLPQPERAIEFLLSQRCDDGGFREIRVAKRAGTNPTTAAVATLRILAALDDDTRARTTAFLVDMQTDEGGLRANTRIPIADLLSTFTGLLTLVDLGARDGLDVPRLRRYVESLERPEGGFRGAAWDEGHDVEYTFYGLGCLALLSS